MKTREEYLQEATGLFAETIFREQGYEVPAKIQISVGFPKGARGGKGYRAVGQAWAPVVSEDRESFNVFISPEIGDEIEALGILIHELVHCVVGLQAGHKAPFKRCATDVGLTGKMTATHCSDDLRVTLEECIGADLGPYPHSALKPVAKGARGSRLIKIVCPSCYDSQGNPFCVRITRKWLDGYGPTICPGCHETMQEQEV